MACLLIDRGKFDNGYDEDMPSLVGRARGWQGQVFG